MRIARIIEYFPPHIGGMERHGLMLSIEQAKMGHNIDILIGYGGNADTLMRTNDANGYLKIYKMPFQILPPYSKMRRLWFNIWAYFAVRNRHKKDPYSIIHLHGDFVEAYLGGKLSKKLNIPSVLTIHAGLNKKRLKLKNKRFFDNISKIICVSEEIRQDLLGIGVASDKFEVISSGIYLSDFQKTNNEQSVKLRGQFSQPIIISVGVLRMNKGFNYLVEAFKEIKQTIKTGTLLIIGDGPERNKLEKQARDIPDVYFLGKDYENVIRYLPIADVFVSASINSPGDREGTSTVIMEAMAAGLPIISTMVGGNPRLIKDGVNGLLVEEKNSGALARAILKITGDADLRRKMRDQNLTDVKPKDWPVIARRVIEIYESILQKP